MISSDILSLKMIRPSSSPLSMAPRTDGNIYVPNTLALFPTGEGGPSNPNLLENYHANLIHAIGVPYRP